MLVQMIIVVPHIAFPVLVPFTPRVCLADCLLVLAMLDSFFLCIIRSINAIQARLRTIIVEPVLFLFLDWKYDGFGVQGLAGVRRLARCPHEALLVYMRKPVDVLSLLRESFAASDMAICTLCLGTGHATDPHEA